MFIKFSDFPQIPIMKMTQLSLQKTIYCSKNLKKRFSSPKTIIEPDNDEREKPPDGADYSC